MKKYFTFFVPLIATFCFAQEQDGYIKYNTDFEYRNKTVKVFKGEIVPFVKTSNPNRINVIIGTDTLTDLGIVTKIFEVDKSAVGTYNSLKTDLLQLKTGAVVWVNAIAIPNTDTVTLISESGEILTQLIEKREAQVRQSDLGKTCRLIISKSPSIFYSTNKLKQFVEPKHPPVEKPEPRIEIIETDLVLWQKMLLSVFFLGIFGFCGWWFNKRRITKSVTNRKPNYRTYRDELSLKDFAENHHIDLNTLIRYNKDTIDKKFNRYNISDQKKVQNHLNNKKLIVGYLEEGSENSINHYYKTEIKNETILKDRDIPNKIFVQSTNSGNSNELSVSLQQMEKTLIHEIRQMSTGINNQNVFYRLQNEKDELGEKLKSVVLDKSILEKNLQDANENMRKLQNEMKELKERVIAVEFLKGYSESVFNYIKYCQLVSSDAYNFFNKISQQNPKQTFAAGHLLMKFQSVVNLIPIGDWLRTVQDIKDTGATTNRQLTRSFSQIQNDGDKQKEFQRLLFSEVLTKYSSKILILTEAFKNLSRFQGSADYANEAQSIFGKHVTEIVSKAKSTGLEIKHVPLFESWEKYLGHVEDNGGEKSLAYKEITGLEKGAIAEIVSYGVKTSIGDDTKTIIILA